MQYISNTFSNIDKEAATYLYNNFKKLKKDSEASDSNFSFTLLTLPQLKKCFGEISSSSSPGVSKIPTKILKEAFVYIGPTLLDIFNTCIKTNVIPDQFKFAECIPLLKKGSQFDMNNYRGISVLPPIAKLLEKLLAIQIKEYFESNKLFYSGQHGFRKGYSCESALHELITDINTNQDNRLITILLFIDFRKAFDLVDSELLMRKLFHYGFNSNALDLIKSYFTNRKQHMKIGDLFSTELFLILGVPQGSVLGPLFFLIFINDLPFIMNLSAKLFADDTTFYDSGNDIVKLISNFKKGLEPLLEWCKYNRLDINFKKTYCMIVTRKRIVLPKTITLNNIEIEVVDSFKLLGVTIDNKLTFTKYISIVCGRVNSVLYSIKRLFFLPLITKIQFFKTFILPLFDYCLSLTIYYAKYVIAKLSNCYYITMAKLFNSNKSDKFNFTNKSPEEIQSFLTNYNLFSFSHRVFVKLDLFLFKIINTGSPPILNTKLTVTNEDTLANRLKSNNINKIYVPSCKQGYGEKTFTHFGAIFYNSFLSDSIQMNLYEFKRTLFKNLDIFHKHFIETFYKFNIAYSFRFFKDRQKV